MDQPRNAVTRSVDAAISATEGRHVSVYERRHAASLLQFLRFIFCLILLLQFAYRRHRGSTEACLDFVILEDKPNDVVVVCYLYTVYNYYMCAVFILLLVNDSAEGIFDYVSKSRNNTYKNYQVECIHEDQFLAKIADGSLNVDVMKRFIV